MENFIVIKQEDWDKLHERFAKIEAGIEKLSSPVSRMSEEYLYPQEVARMLGVSMRTLYYLMKSGDLPFKQYNRKRKVKLSDLIAYLEKSENTGENDDSVPV